MEKAFAAAWEKCRAQAAAAGVRMRPVEREALLDTARRNLNTARLSDGFAELKKIGHLEWSLEALAIDRRFTPLFTDEQANEALQRLMEAGYFQGTSE